MCIGYGFYTVLILPYFILPKADIAFLSTKPPLHEVVSRFGEPAEKITEGEFFQMTGWHPLPSSPATHVGISFVRRYGSKIYIFFDADNRVFYYKVATS
jgi:hypothetical protein